MTNKDFFNSKDNKFWDVTLIVDKEDELKHVTKSALFHNIVCLSEQLNDIIEERDAISLEEERLNEEINNLKIIIDKLQIKNKELEAQK